MYDKLMNPVKCVLRKQTPGAADQGRGPSSLWGTGPLCCHMEKLIQLLT